MDLGLTDKVAVVTGASKGIGLAVTRALLDEGAHVVAGARSSESLEGMQRVTAVALDLASPEAPARLIDRAIDEHGRVDVLVNNVGGVRLRLEGFLGTEEVAALIVMLASERTGNVTGANYIIDGGLIKTTQRDLLPDMARFVVQLHDATSLHFDLRLQIGDLLRSWAVPKGPSLDPSVRRLAVPVEDHSLAAGEFEGVHEGHGRGSGAVIIWDEGTAQVLREEPDHLSFVLQGQKLTGRFGLTKTGERRWILVKARDEHARPGSDIVAELPTSVRSNRTWKELADEGTPDTARD